jgi:hypothetical protein
MAPPPGRRCLLGTHEGPRMRRCWGSHVGGLDGADQVGKEKDS